MKQEIKPKQVYEEEGSEMNIMLNLNSGGQ